MTKKIFVAKYAYKCALCGASHAAGTRTTYNDAGQASAADCLWPEKAKIATLDANPAVLSQKPPAGPESPSPGSAVEPAGAFSTEQNLSWAIHIASREVALPDAATASRPAAYANLIAEVMREEHANYMSEQIQRNKEKNMRAIR